MGQERGRRGTHRIKVGDDLVEEAQTLNAAVVDALLRVEVGEVGQGGKHDSDLIVRLAVQLLREAGPELSEKRRWNDVPQK